MKLSLLIAVAASNLSVTSAWGTLGHEAVAYLATHYLTPQTAAYCRGLLADHGSDDDYLASVATWADSYRYTRAGRFSEPLHFIDAKDHPPGECSVDFERDCKAAGCVVSAIQNYTNRLFDSTLTPSEHTIALKFLVHLVGDIHQPLHTEDLQRGGNGIAVRYGSATTNLHAVWDTWIPEAIASRTTHSAPYTKRPGGATLVIAHRWAESLAHDVDMGRFSAEAPTWVAGLAVSHGLEAAMAWARDANAFVCSTVMPDGVASVEDQDLAGAYTAVAEPVVELLVARAGYRLGAWLNLVVERLGESSQENTSTEDLGDDGDAERLKIDGEVPQLVLQDL